MGKWIRWLKDCVITLPRRGNHISIGNGEYHTRCFKAGEEVRVQIVARRGERIVKTTDDIELNGVEEGTHFEFIPAPQTLSKRE